MTPWRILGWIFLAASGVSVFFPHVVLATIILACAMMSLIGDVAMRRQSKQAAGPTKSVCGGDSGRSSQMQILRIGVVRQREWLQVLEDVWRPQGDSNPCYRRERAVS